MKIYSMVKVVKASRKGLSLLSQSGYWMNKDGTISKRHKRSKQNPNKNTYKTKSKALSNSNATQNNDSPKGL